MPVNPIDYLKSLLNPSPAKGGGEDIDLPSETFVGPREPKYEVSPWRKAATIGASKIGERYAEPKNPTTVDLIRQFTFGAERPRSVAAMDPYGIEAWKIGAGPPPGLMMGSTEEVGGEALKKSVAGLRGFFSRVDKTAEELPSQMHPVKAESIFKNNAAREEVDYRGLSDFLKSKTGPKVSKTEIQSHLAEHPMPTIEVKDLGGPAPAVPGVNFNEGYEPQYGRPEPTKYARPSLNVPGGENYRERLLTLPSPEDKLASIDTGSKHFSDWHYNRYGTHPVEDDFTDPGTIRAYMAHNGMADNGAQEFQSSHWDDPNVLAHSRFDERTLNPQFEPKWRVEPNDSKMVPTHAAEYPWRVVDAHTGEGQFWAPTEQEAHSWLQRDPFAGDTPRPADFNQRPAGGDKGRFLQEVQSDWHQQGKELGYGGDSVWHEKLNTLKAHADQTRTHFNDLAEEFGKRYQIDPGAVMDQIHTEIPDSVTRMPLHMFDDADMQKILATHSAPDPQAAREALYPEFRQKYYPYALNADDRQLMQQAHFQRQAARMALTEHQSTAPSNIPDAPFKESWPDLVLKEHVMDVAQHPDLNWLGFTTGETQNKRYDLAQHVRNLEYNPDLGQLDLELINGGRQTVHTPPDQLHTHIGRDMAKRLLENPDSKIPDDLGGVPTGSNWHTVNLNMNEPLTVGGAGMRHFYDKKLPSALSKILKPFGGKVELGEIPGDSRRVFNTEIENFRPHGGSTPGQGYVGEVHINGKHVASTLPSQNRVQTGQNVYDLMNTIAAQPAPVQMVPAWIAHLPPEMKKAIMEKGLPLLTLLGMTQMHQSDDQSQAPAGAVQGLKHAR